MSSETSAPDPNGPLFLPPNFSLNYLEELQLLNALELSRKTLARRVCAFAHLVSIPSLTFREGKRGFASFLSQLLEPPVPIPNTELFVTHCVWEILEEEERALTDVELEYTTYDFRTFYDNILAQESLPPCTLTAKEFNERLLHEKKSYSMEFIGSMKNNCACVIFYREDAVYVANLRETCTVHELIQEKGVLDHKFLTDTGRVVTRQLTNCLHKYPYPEEELKEA